MALKRYVLITAGGRGTRMQSDVPKQFLLLKDRPILMHTMQVFHDVLSDMEFVVVLPGEMVDTWESLCTEHGFNMSHRVVEGGETRFHSVKNGLEAVPAGMLVAIHDAVRPLVSPRVIREGFEMARIHGNAVPAIEPGESVRKVTGTGNEPVDRSALRLVQTPQVFDSSLIKRAYQVDYDPAFTDDATVLERAGKVIHLFKGNPENIKITRPSDLILASALLKS
jgi:2-C-methyl-D-erythritol 4-phosphate cytidylyltransferase